MEGMGAAAQQVGSAGGWGTSAIMMGLKPTWAHRAGFAECSLIGRVSAWRAGTDGPGKHRTDMKTEM